MENISNKPKPLKRRDIAYYRQRQKNRVFSALVAFFAEEAERGRVTKKKLAELLGKDPAQITRWLSSPSNFELDTISDILLAMGAEMDHQIVRFSERPKQNYAHALMREYALPSTSEGASGIKITGNLNPYVSASSPSAKFSLELVEVP
jgi:hypothetical protein